MRDFLFSFGGQSRIKTNVFNNKCIKVQLVSRFKKATIELHKNVSM